MTGWSKKQTKSSKERKVGGTDEWRGRDSQKVAKRSMRQRHDFTLQIINMVSDLVSMERQILDRLQLYNNNYFLVTRKLNVVIYAANKMQQIVKLVQYVCVPLDLSPGLYD